MTYAIETRAETLKSKQVLNATEINTLRRICGVILRDQKRSEEIRDDCGVLHIYMSLIRLYMNWWHADK